jgi:multiple sugar transport system substrate-binding protein
MPELVRIEGRLMGIPRNIDVKLLCYPTDLFEAEELKSEFRRRFGGELWVPQTWEELREIAEFLTCPPHLYGFVFPGRYSGLFGHFFELNAMAGGKLFNERLEAAFDDQKGRWALGLLRELYTKAGPPNLPAWHFGEVTRFFLDGQAAMTTDWPAFNYPQLGLAGSGALRFPLRQRGTGCPWRVGESFS